MVNVLLPIKIGSPEVTYPRINNLSAATSLKTATAGLCAATQGSNQASTFGKSSTNSAPRHCAEK